MRMFANRETARRTVVGESVAGRGKDSQLSDQDVQPLFAMNVKPSILLCQAKPTPTDDICADPPKDREH